MPNFKIEDIFKLSKKLGVYIAVRQMDEDENWSINKGSKLGEFELELFMDVPRKLDENGNLDFKLYVFKMRNDEDCEKVKKGDELELH